MGCSYKTGAKGGGPQGLREEGRKGSGKVEPHREGGALVEGPGGKPGLQGVRGSRLEGDFLWRLTSQTELASLGRVQRPPGSGIRGRCPTGQTRKTEVKEHLHSG